jgi:hypothetical protein
MLDKDSPLLGGVPYVARAPQSDALPQPAARVGSGLEPRQFVAIVGGFWVYVTISNVLYAHGMSVGFAGTDHPPFAPWDQRVLQHLLLLPVLFVSFWASLRVQWRPLLVALPLQLVLAMTFAALAYPAMIAAQILSGSPHWLEHAAGQADSPLQNPAYLSLWLASFLSFLPSYGFGLALVTGIALYARFRDAELRVATLEREWAAARLAALRMQLSPHTLFNLLHTIRGHIEWDPQSAQTMLVQLGDLLRRCLRAGEKDFSRLADEMQFTRLYLELQQKRFADRLTVSLPEVGAIGGIWVPSLILQPLVENAVVHGLAGHSGAVHIRMEAEVRDEVVVLRVLNTVSPTARDGEPGIGIRNVRERLAVQFSEAASLTSTRVGAEWLSELMIPAVADAPEALEPRPARPPGRLVGAG